MRIEATREEWKRLYQLAIRCKRMQEELNKILNEMNLFSVCFSEKETIYFNILGDNYMCAGLSIYEGREGLNNLMGLIFAEQINLDFYDMVMAQNCIYMHFENRDDVPEKQYQVISDLNLRFRGNGNWIYFETFEKGYYPSICNQKEVRSAIRYLEKFIEGIKYYKNGEYKTDRNKGEIFQYYCKDGVWRGRIQSILMQEYQYPVVCITDDFTKAKLRKAAKVKTGIVMEVKTFYYGEGVYDENYDKIIVPKIAVLANHYNSLLMDYQMILPEEDTDNRLIFILSEWIREYGCPREIIVSDVVTRALIEDVCKICRIKLTEGDTSVIDEIQANIENEIKRPLDEWKKAELVYNSELLETLGFDMEDIKRKSRKMPREELLKYVMGQLNDLLQDIYKEQERFDDLDTLFYQVELNNRKEKIQAVKDFFGQGRINRDIEQSCRCIWIEYCIIKWMNILRQSKKTELTALADRIGILENKSMTKEQIIREVQSQVQKKPKLLADSVGDNEKNLLKYLWKKAKKRDFKVEIQNFPSNMNTILKLVAMGMIDVQLKYDKYESDLILKPIKEMEKLLKKWI